MSIWLISFLIGVFCTYYCCDKFYLIDFRTFLQFIKLILNSGYVTQNSCNFQHGVLHEFANGPLFLLSLEILMNILKNITPRKKLCWIDLDKLYEITLYFHFITNFVKVSIILGCAEKATLACINLDSSTTTDWNNSSVKCKLSHSSRWDIKYEVSGQLNVNINFHWWSTL